MNATASKLNFKLKLERYFQRKYLTHLFPTLHTRRPNTQWAGYSKGLPCTLSLVTLSLLSSNLTMSASSCFYTDSCVSLQQLWRSSSTEWARSRVQPQDCKNKTTNTTAQQRTHKAFPKSQLMSSPSLVPPYFTLSLYSFAFTLPNIAFTATIYNRITTRSTVFIYLGISTTWLFPAQRPSNDFVWIWMNSNSILKLLSFQLRWETLQFLAATDLSPEATSWTLSCSLGIQRIFPVTY